MILVVDQLGVWLTMPSATPQDIYLKVILLLDASHRSLTGCK